MSQEQNLDIIALWESITFDGKELFTLNDAGGILLHAGQNGKERLIVEITPDNSATVFEELFEKFAVLQAKVAEVALEWESCDDKLKMADKVGHLKNHIIHTPFLGNITGLNAEIAKWDELISAIHEENYATKLNLAEQVEALAESIEWKEATATIKEIIDQWKHTGHTDKHRGDKLWSRIDAARAVFNDRKHKHFEDQEKDLLGNLDLKLDLVEQAESLTQSTEWKKTSDTFHRLTTEWKTIGQTLNKKNEELWQRFIAAKSAFFDRKREHSERIAVEQEQNYITKSALVEKAEAMRESTEWNNTAIAYAALMEEWKKTGRVSGEKGDELWNRFTGAQEQFFSAKKAHTEEIRTMHEQNYDLKMEILKRADRIKNSTSWSDTTAEMNQLLDEWKAIGPVSRAHSNKIWEEFLAARKHFFARKDANREQRKQVYDSHKETRSVQAKEMVLKLLTDIQEEEDKLVDFKSALENITPGKKAKELRKHLEQLLLDGDQKIKRLKEKYAAVQDEYGKQAEDAAKAIAKNNSEKQIETSPVTDEANTAETETTKSDNVVETNTVIEAPVTDTADSLDAQPADATTAAPEVPANVEEVVANQPATDESTSVGEETIAEAPVAAEASEELSIAETTSEPSVVDSPAESNDAPAEQNTTDTDKGKEEA